MGELQTVFEFLKSGGALAVVVLMVYMLMSGKLRLEREVGDRDEALKQCGEELRNYRDKFLPLLERQQNLIEELKDNVSNPRR